jgi:hypothetical protein
MTDPKPRMDPAALAQQIELEKALGGEPGLKAMMARIKARDAEIRAAAGDPERVRALGAEQQADLLRLQVAANKHAEATELMSNYIKKMQDSQAAVIRNMR